MITADLTMASVLAHRSALREASTTQYISAKVCDVKDIALGVTSVSHIYHSELDTRMQLLYIFCCLRQG